MDLANDRLSKPAVIHQILSAMESEDAGTCVIAVEDFSALGCNIETGKISLEDVPILFFEGHLVLQFSSNDFCLLANPPAEDESPRNAGDRGKEERGNKPRCALGSEPGGSGEYLDAGYSAGY